MFQSYHRTLLSGLLAVICAIAALLPGVFNLAATVIPLLFPSLGARLHGQFFKNA